VYFRFQHSINAVTDSHDFFYPDLTLQVRGRTTLSYKMYCQEQRKGRVEPAVFCKAEQEKLLGPRFVVRETSWGTAEQSLEESSLWGELFVGLRLFGPLKLDGLNRKKTSLYKCTVVPPCPWVIRSNSYRGYVKLRIIPNAIYNVIFV
jgi:hypothetical protein